jgi:UDP-N-acetylglucosamine 4,6-dehydratase
MHKLNGASVLVTGGAGTLGRAFVRRALDLEARAVTVYSRDESKHARMRAEFGDDARLRFVVGDVRDFDRLYTASSGTDVLVHAAAMKRVDACEENVVEAISTNVVGTVNAAAAVRGVGVLISTDKAVEPVGVYGTTKFMAEQLWTRLAGRGGACLAVLRLGNLVGSTGSVVELWRSQVARGEPITVTEPTATRFWIRVERAAHDVVEVIDSVVENGGIAVPLIGSASVGRLAGAVAPGAEQRRVGLRPGEKMHEALLAPHEYERAYRHVTESGALYVVGRSAAPGGPLAFVYDSDSLQMSDDALAGLLA